MHELWRYAEQASLEISLEYQRIFSRSLEDPGTAGDEGEENWAELLRHWLPSHYHVVTKGRILGSNGEASKQFDVLVLHPTYPSGLLAKKLYIAPGVVAAFECKLTLKQAHIGQAFRRSANLKRLHRSEKDYNAPIVGLLAHAHSWKSNKAANIERMGSLIYNSYCEHVQNLPENLDIISIASLGTWGYRNLTMPPDAQHPTALYIGPNPTPETHLALESGISPIGAFLNHLMFLLAQKEPELHHYQWYFEEALTLGLVRMTIVGEWPGYVKSTQS